MNRYEQRRARVAAYLKKEGIGAALFEDSEGARNQAVRYLCGQPGDALLVVSAQGPSVLVAWDINMAAKLASVEARHALGDYERRVDRALAAAAAELGLSKGARIELPSNFAHPRFLRFQKSLPDYELLCREGGVDEYLRSIRAVKDQDELAIYRKAAALTDELIGRIEADVRSGAIQSELDAALLIERMGRGGGAEGTGFETLAAGASRSFGIHAFPPFGSGAFGGEGMSILDFGLKVEGYTTDVTMSFVRGSLGPVRERMHELVLEARKAALKCAMPGKPTREAALAVSAVFAAGGMSMPHGLGHGIGLDAHEAPAINTRDENKDLFEPGNVVAIEPGLYHPELGGIRYEDDVIITENGHELITHSRIVRL